MTDAPIPQGQAVRESLTDRQQQVLNFIRAHHRATDSMPTHKEIAEHFGWTSLNSAAECIARIVHKGHLRYHYGTARGLRFAAGDGPWDQLDRLEVKFARERVYA